MKTQMPFPELPYYLTVYQITEGNTVRIEVESKIHVNKVVEMPTSFSTDFVASKPGTFRKDVLDFIIRRYGLKLEPPKYV